MKKPTDTQRLNWLEKQNAFLKFDAEDEHSLPHAAVFLPTIKNGESTFATAGQGDTFRAAIDNAMANTAKKPSLTSHDLAEAFLQWPLPESVCADLCATKQGPGRVGTNLLSYTEAKQMFEQLLMNGSK